MLVRHGMNSEFLRFDSYAVTLTHVLNTGSVTDLLGLTIHNYTEKVDDSVTNTIKEQLSERVITLLFTNNNVVLPPGKNAYDVIDALVLGDNLQLLAVMYHDLCWLGVKTKGREINQDPVSSSERERIEALKKNKDEASFLSKVFISFLPGFILFLDDGKTSNLWLESLPSSLLEKIHLLLNDTPRETQLMSLIGEKGNFGVQANMAGHPNGTIAKIRHVGNLRLTSNVVLFDVLVIHEYTDLKKEIVLGTDSEFGGLYMFDVDWEVIMDHQSIDTVEGQPFDCGHTASSMDDNPISEGNVPVFQNVPTIDSSNRTELDSLEVVSTRRSSRMSKLPEKLNDFPTCYNEAVKDINWVQAMNNEMEALYLNNTWILADLLKNRKVISSKWVYKIKYKANGEIERYKARLVAKGFGRKERIDYDESFSPVVKMSIARCFINMAVQNS
ncbi:ribonuclease H-like domain-containing protein [Tanacetum coccineum]